MERAHLHYRVLSTHRTSPGQGLPVLLGEPGQNPQLVGLGSLSPPSSKLLNSVVRPLRALEFQWTGFTHKEISNSCSPMAGSAETCPETFSRRQVLVTNIQHKHSGRAQATQHQTPTTGEVLGLNRGSQPLPLICSHLIAKRCPGPRHWATQV